MIHFVFTLLLALSSHALWAEAMSEKSQNSYENSLLETIQAIQHQKHDQALADTRAFLKTYPTSKLGQMLYADLLTAQAGVLPSMGFGIRSKPELRDLTMEIQQRLSSQQTPAHDGYLPRSLVTLADNHDHLLVMDQSQSRLYVYSNQQGTPVLVDDFFLSIGLNGFGKEKQGDQKTPIGIYHVTRYIDGSRLPDLYGAGAFPVNYPNAWDQRLRRTGNGIWIHGSPSGTYNRAPLSSNGCMVVSNPDFERLKSYINPAQLTPVVISDKIHWLTPSRWQQQQQELLQAISQWVNDWESMNHERYISHYSSSDFHSQGRDFRRWDSYKKWVNRAKTHIAIDIKDLSLYRYPGEADLVLAHFRQQYRSNNFNNSVNKELFWNKQQERWQIVYEGVRDFSIDFTDFASN